MTSTTFEAHGTGTALGDPIEVQAAAAVYGAGDRSAPLLMGSVKTNIGHLESAAGVAGLIKIVLSLEHEILPKNLHFEHPSPHIPWDQLAVRVVDEPTPWQANAHARRAGISSFGFSGTNAHVVIEEAPATAEVALTDSPPESAGVLALSARSAQALVAVTRRYGDWLDAHPDVDIADVCAVAGAGRSHFEHRAALVVDSVKAARDLLSELAENRLAPGALRGVSGNQPKTAWLFTGQGSQYAGMTRELFDAEPVFNETVTRCAEAVGGIVPRPLLEVLFGTAARPTPTATTRTRCGTRPLPNRRCSPSRWAWPGCGSRGASSPTWCSATAWASTRRRAWPGCSSSRTEPGWWPNAAGCSATCPRAAEWWPCSTIPNTWKTSPTNFPGVGGRVQRPQHGAVGPRRGPGTVGRDVQ